MQIYYPAHNLMYYKYSKNNEKVFQFNFSRLLLVTSFIDHNDII